MAPRGNLIRLIPLHINEVPAHTALKKTPTTISNANANSSQNPTGDSPGVIAFAKAVLDEGTGFADTDMPVHFSRKSVKKPPPSKTDVEVLEHFISSNSESRSESAIPRHWSGQQKLDETWFARRSYHPNHSVAGSADFDEFDMGLRHDHSRHEKEYTPDVFDAYKVLDWDEEIKSAVVSESGLGEYTEVSMSSEQIFYNYILNTWCLIRRLSPDSKHLKHYSSYSYLFVIHYFSTCALYKTSPNDVSELVDKRAFLTIVALDKLLRILPERQKPN